MSNLNEILVATVKSLGHPQSGQKHRSSGNFSTDSVPAEYANLRWEVTDTSHPEKVKFKVMQDKSAGIDPTIYPEISSGSQTELKRYRRLYIADPSTQSGGDFTVKVYAF